MTLSVRLRPATAKEIPRLQAMLSDDTGHGIRSVLAGHGGLGERVFLIEYSGQIAGFCTYRSEPDEIFPLVVFAPFRRKGVGVEAMRQLIELLQSEGRKAVFLDVLPDAIPFWEEVFSEYPVEQVFDSKYVVDISGRP